MTLPEEPVKVSILYRGPSVDDGTMPVADVLSALRGFTGAYGKIASRETPTVQHELRVCAVRSGSFEIALFAACVVLSDPATQRTILETVSGASQYVIKFLLNLIRTHQHTKGKPISIDVSGTGNTVNVINMEGSKLMIPKGVAESYNENLAGPELGKLVSPLGDGVDSLEISAEAGEEKSAALIESGEKGYFSSPSEETTSTLETTIKGSFVSLNKDRNTGLFRLASGTSIKYNYAADDSNKFYQDFAYRGLVEVTCIATLDEDLQPLRLSITDVKRVQGRLPL